VPRLGYCGRHRSGLVATYKPHNFGCIGVGMCRDDPPIADDGAVYVRCSLCGATWLGRVLDRCTWCAHALVQQQAWQVRLVLQAPEVDPDDVVRYETTMRGWGERLATAVAAGLIDRNQARRAWRRGVKRDHVTA
jgi:hypothetical protein